jgi:archaellum biogenesis protein FlaJ (TadC family)
MQASQLAVTGSAASNSIVPPLKIVAILMAPGHTKTAGTITGTTTALLMAIAVLALALTTQAGAILMSSVIMNAAVTRIDPGKVPRDEITAKIPSIPMSDRPIATGIRVEAINNEALMPITGSDGILIGIIARRKAMIGITGLIAMVPGATHTIHAGRVARRRSAEITRDNRENIQTLHRKTSYTKAITSNSVRLVLPEIRRNNSGSMKILQSK